MRLLQFPLILVVAALGVIVLVQSVRGQSGGQEAAVPTPTLTAGGSRRGRRLCSQRRTQTTALR